MMWPALSWSESGWLAGVAQGFPLPAGSSTTLLFFSFTSLLAGGLWTIEPPTGFLDDGSSVAHSALIGGEVEALRRLKSFAAEHLGQSSTSNSKSTVSGESLYGSNFSCKISPWLAMGCLSPRRMFEDLQKNVKRVSAATASSSSVSSDNGLNWLVFELLWRDFFRFITKKYAVSKQTTEVVTASPVPV
ncbi:hypothetical protein GOP47_0010635 [Adiantum capillus-veneris]|uniref:Photolyase/cryptochrome alpha/beta domain-containing protein n=1 Tax=Adiantum capillus-veneris TaxID=13818 RepID=A0A9D4UVA0_ADICA|nr:hypothetical protein GOP47_0010635 [Adiantum capillus-veneris]